MPCQFPNDRFGLARLAKLGDELVSEENTRSTMRVIRSAGRFDQTPVELVVELTSDEYVALGLTRVVEAQEAEVAILAAAPKEVSDAVGLEELPRTANVKRATGRRTVEALLGQNRLTRMGKGKRGNTGHLERFLLKPRPLLGRTILDTF